MNYGIRVVLKDGGEGYIMRRLDSHSYEIWVESRAQAVVLSPDDFEEKEKDE